MKNLLIFLFAVLTISCVFVSCDRNELIDVPDCKITFNRDSVQLKGASLVSISSIAGGTYGFGTYSSYFVADYEGTNSFAVTGKGFGTKQGCITVSGATGYTVSKISSWSDTKILCLVKSSPNSEATTKASICIRPSTGGCVEKSINLVPYIFGKQFQQCTWWANKRRIEKGLSYQQAGKTYSNYSGTVDANYIPKSSDILIWNNVHEAFVESVSTSSSKNSDGSTTFSYTVNISEYNITSEKYSPYSTTVKVTEYKGKRTIISGLYRSGLKTSATNYFR